MKAATVHLTVAAFLYIGRVERWFIEEIVDQALITLFEKRNARSIISSFLASIDIHSSGI